MPMARPPIAYTGPDKVTVQPGGSTSATATASGGQPDHTFTKTDGPDWVTIPDGSTITVTDAPETPGTHTVNVGIGGRERVYGYRVRSWWRLNVRTLWSRRAPIP